MNCGIRLLDKIIYTCQALGTPHGLKLRFSSRVFGLSVLRVCNRLQASGITPATIFDVGANVGQFALAASVVWNEAAIFSYEPVDAAYQRLRENTTRYPRIHPRQIALGASGGEVNFQVASNLESSSALKMHKNHKLFYPDVSQTSVQSVRMSTLALELKATRIQGPTFLKLDVQGLELDVIRGAGNELSQFDWIVLETSQRPMYEGEASFTQILEVLQAENFSFVAPMDLHMASMGIPAQFDVLFKNNCCRI